MHYCCTVTVTQKPSLVRLVHQSHQYHCIRKLYIEVSLYIVNFNEFFLQFTCSSASMSNWAEKLVVPTRFSSNTMTAMKEGVLTSKARDEIMTSLSTLIMVHTMRPTPDDYTTVCRRLVEKHS